MADPPAKTLGWSNRLVLLPFVLLVSILSILGALVIQSGRDYGEADRSIEHSQESVSTLEEVFTALEETESAARGYVLTGDPLFLQQHAAAVRILNVRLPVLRSVLAEAPEPEHRVDHLIPLLRDRIEFASRVIEERRQGSLESAAQLIASDRGVRDVAGLRTAMREKQASEIALLDKRRQRSAAFRQKLLLCFSVLLVVAFATLVAALIEVRRKYREQVKKEDALRVSQASLEAANRELHTFLEEANRRTREIRELNELGEMLQSSISFAEAYALFSAYLPRLFPDVSGALITVSPSRKLLGVVAQVGEVHFSHEVSNAETCWALRRGKPYHVHAGLNLPVCDHANGRKGESVCLPLIANGEPIGVLHLQGAFGDKDNRKLVLAEMLAEQYSLALSNLRLREHLREQSIRDPLTGLFNRRYLEESLEREVARARRNRTMFAVMMLDLDHFKAFNDSYGHNAGDLLLREFGAALRSGVRSEDIACRYGGEEFTVVLLSANEAGVRMRAEEIRLMTKKLQVKIGDTVLPQVSVVDWGRNARRLLRQRFATSRRHRPVPR